MDTAGQSQEAAAKPERKPKGIRFTGAEDIGVAAAPPPAEPEGTQHEISPVSDSSKTPLRFTVPDLPTLPREGSTGSAVGEVVDEAEAVEPPPVLVNDGRPRDSRTARIRRREKTPFSPRTFAQFAHPAKTAPEE